MLKLDMRILLLLLLSSASFADAIYKLGLGYCIDQDYPTPAWKSIKEEFETKS